MTPPVLYVYDGKMTKVGIDAVVRRQLAALTEEAHLDVELVSRGRSHIPGVIDKPRYYSAANLISWLPRKIYYGARRRLHSIRGKNMVRRHDYSAVISWPQRALHVFREAKKRGIPTLLNCDIVHFATRLSKKRVFRWPEFSINEQNEEYELADAILVPSDYSRQTFLDFGIPAKKLVVIGRGVDTDLYCPAPDFDADVPKESRPFRVLFCGRVGERKGIRQVIDAWRAASIPNAELWVAGEVDPESEAFVHGVRDLNIRFRGFRRDLADLVPQCDVQILLSRMEGMTKSLLEGAACGLATIATVETGFPFEEGVNGFAVKRTDIETVAARLNLLANDRKRCREMGRRGRLAVLESYTWARFNERFLSAVEPFTAKKTSLELAGQR
ncbi:MAG TPA: glycosyltransferase family 4 protein [Chthoniobacterales bacterium]